MLDKKPGVGLGMPGLDVPRAPLATVVLVGPLARCPPAGIAVVDVVTGLVVVAGRLIVVDGRTGKVVTTGRVIGTVTDTTGVDDWGAADVVVVPSNEYRWPPIVRLVHPARRATSASAPKPAPSCALVDRDRHVRPERILVIDFALPGGSSLNGEEPPGTWDALQFMLAPVGHLDS